LFSFGRKLKVDLAELEDEEKGSLSGFLRTTLNKDVVSDGNHILVDSRKLSLQELERVVNKFIYHRHLNNTYWVASEHDGVKIRKFERKKERKKKQRVTPPSTIKHGW